MYTPLPEKVDKQETNDKRKKQPSEDSGGEEEEEQTMTERKKRKRKTKRICSEEEQAGPSTRLTPNLRSNSLKGSFCKYLQKSVSLSDQRIPAVYNAKYCVLLLPSSFKEGREARHLDLDHL